MRFVSCAALAALAALVAPVGPRLEAAAKQVKILSPEASLRLMQLQPGYKLEVVLAEPHIKEPVVAVFDGNGRMYVAEMRTYMQDVDGSNKFNRISRVSRHEDTNGDGKYDKHTVFVDNLMLPRMVLPLDDRVIIGETNTNDLYVYRDRDGDGVSDEKKLFYKGGRRGGNLEHQPSGLVWSIDNWLYTTYNAYRLRYRNGKVDKESTGPNGGQWGLAQDNYGKLWFVNGGGERGPLNFQQPIVYGAFGIGGETPGDWRTVWPIDNIPDTQGGRRRLRNNNTLNHFTATAGAAIFRGDRLPEEIRGDIFFSEPVGRLIRRGKVTVDDGVTYLKNPYDKNEFMRSKDPNFRVVNAHTAPDGTMYLIDMYRGIIQEGNWVKKGSYLRKIVKEYGLDNNFGHGRIYRLTHRSFKRGPRPRMLNERPSQLVAHLEHPNGWWRDTAQKLLILRGDKSVVSSLKRMAASSRNHLAKIHALWTLEGLGAADAALLRQALKDKHPQVRRAAIRVSETLFKAGDESLLAALKAAAEDTEPDVVIQSLMTMKHLKVDGGQEIIASKSTSTSKGVSEIARKLQGRRGGGGGPTLSKAQRGFLRKGEATYKTLCFSCHGKDGRGQPMAGAPKGTFMAPSFVGAKTLLGHPGLPINVVLHGLTGPVRGKKYTGQMLPMKSYNDEWIASVLTYVRNSFGNSASWIGAKDVAAVRTKSKFRRRPYTMTELEKLIPHLLTNRKQWKLTASHNGGKVGSAVDGNRGTRYDTSTPQKKGMWFQIQFSRTTTLEGLTLDTRGSNGDYPRGYTVQISNDGRRWSRPVAEGRGSGPVTEIFLVSPQRTRFVRITLTAGVRGLYWSIHELQIYGRP